MRADGSGDDAFAYFESLHAEGRLLPSSDDELRDKAEHAARTIESARGLIPEGYATAMRHLDKDVRVVLEGGINLRLHVPASEDEVWVAIQTRTDSGDVVGEPLRDVLFALALEAARAVESEPRPGWPNGTLEWYEVARLGLRDP
jgi:hypothetical protein